jgi:hypothetical protein
MISVHILVFLGARLVTISKLEYSHRIIAIVCIRLCGLCAIELELVLFLLTSTAFIFRQCRHLLLLAFVYSSK